MTMMFEVKPQYFYDRKVPIKFLTGEELTEFLNYTEYPCTVRMSERGKL